MKQIQSQNYCSFCQNHRFEGLKDYTDFNIYTEKNPCHLSNQRKSVIQTIKRINLSNIDVNG